MTKVRDYQSEEDVFQHFLEVKESYPELNGLDSESPIAIWRLFGRVFAKLTFESRRLLNLFYTEISTIIAENQVGTLEWYRLQCLKFQYGDDLLISDGRIAYVEENEAKKIIKYASATLVLHELNGTFLQEVVLKVAKQDAGKPISLDNAEYQSFKSYIAKIMFANTYVSIISESTDYIKIIGNIYFDSLLIEADIKQNVIHAIKNHLQHLPFNAQVLKNDIREVIRDVTGVNDCDLTTIEVRKNTGNFEPLEREYIPHAGHIMIDNAFSLEDNLNMIGE